MPAPEIREKILAKASQLFASKGYDAVSMRHVATEAGMTQANLYYHFKDKEDLIRSSLAYVFSGKAQTFETIMQEECDPEKRLERAILWFATLLFEDAIFARLFIRELLVGDNNHLEYLTKNAFQEPFSRMVNLIRDTLNTTDPVLSALFLSSTILGYFQLSGIAQHLRETRPEYADPKTMTQYLMKEIHKSIKTF